MRKAENQDWLAGARQGVCELHAERGAAAQLGDGLEAACFGQGGPHHQDLCPACPHPRGATAGGAHTQLSDHIQKLPCVDNCANKPQRDTFRN